VTARIPDDVEFTTVSALPLALSTAAGGLYERCYLGLTPPKEARFRRKKSGEQVLLVWGGCSSITSCAIQLAVASGLKVLVTAPEKYHGCIRGLGADYVIDQSQKNAVQRLIEAATGKIIIGAFDVVSTKSSSMRCAEFLHHFGGGICFATNPVDFGDHCVLLGDVQRVSGKRRRARRISTFCINDHRPSTQPLLRRRVPDMDGCLV
jgi:NADPH:quinone reductase-like Zn-dependent oxidoreductase